MTLSVRSVLDLPSTVFTSSSYVLPFSLIQSSIQYGVSFYECTLQTIGGHDSSIIIQYLISCVLISLQGDKKRYVFTVYNQTKMDTIYRLVEGRLRLATAFNYALRRGIILCGDFELTFHIDLYYVRMVHKIVST